MKVAGLTGGIGTGKSTVADMLVERGAGLIDADKLARVVVEPGRPAYEDIVAEFGEKVLTEDGTLDRQALADVVFNDKEKRERLNQITHPRIGEEMLRMMDEYREQGFELVVIDAALLLESPATRWIKPAIVVTADVDERIERVCARDDACEEDVRARINSQWSDDERKKLADYVIDNSGDLASLKEQVDRVWRQITGKKDD